MPVAAWLVVISVVPPCLVVSTILLLNYLNRRRLSLATQHFGELSATDVCISLAPLNKTGSRKGGDHKTPARKLPVAEQLRITNGPGTDSFHGTTSREDLTTSPYNYPHNSEVSLLMMNSILSIPATSIRETLPTAPHERSTKGSKARTRPLNSTSCYSPFDNIGGPLSTFGDNYSSLPYSQRVTGETSSNHDWSADENGTYPAFSKRALISPSSSSPLTSSRLSTISENFSHHESTHTAAAESLLYPELAYKRDFSRSTVWRDSSLRGPYHYDYV